MSGRKQHHIPQFFLRSFSEPGAGKKSQVRVITPDRDFLAAIDGVATERNFYSELNAEEETLDDIITDAEAEYLSILNDLHKRPVGIIDETRLIGRLLTHLLVRSGYLRSSMQAFGAYAVKRASDMFFDKNYFRRVLGVGAHEPPIRIRAMFDQAYNEHRAKFQKLKMSRHETRRLMFKMLNENWEQIYAENEVATRLAIRSTMMPGMVSDAHNKSLLKSLEPEQRVSWISEATWEIVDFDQPALVLPDAIALAHDKKRGAMPAMLVNKEENANFLFPISPKRALCSGSYRDPAILQVLTADFGTFAALASWRFVVAPPSFNVTQLPASQIGNGSAAFFFDTVEEGIAEMVAEAFGSKPH